MSYKEQIDPVLREVADLAGIAGVLTIDVYGNILSSLMPSIYDLSTLELACNKLIKTLENLKALNMDFGDMAFHYSEIRLIVNDLNYGFLVVLGLPTHSIRLINVATLSLRNHLRKILMAIPHN